MIIRVGKDAIIFLGLYTGAILISQPAIPHSIIQRAKGFWSRRGYGR